MQKAECTWRKTFSVRKRPVARGCPCQLLLSCTGTGMHRTQRLKQQAVLFKVVLQNLHAVRRAGESALSVEDWQALIEAKQAAHKAAQALQSCRVNLEKAQQKLPHAQRDLAAAEAAVAAAEAAGQ